MAEQEQATTPKWLWALMIVGPVLVAMHHETNFVLVRQACSAQRNIALYVVTIVSLLLTAFTAFLAFSIWKRAGGTWPRDEADLGTRIRFVAIVGLLSSAMSLLVILAQGIATIQFNPCQL